MAAAKVLIVLSLLLYLQLVDCCGIATHIECGYRAAQFFEVISDGVDYPQLLEKHKDAFQAGNPYPDAFYPDLCEDGVFHAVSEDTHWTPFLNVTINYIRRVYPKPWDEATEKLVVFLLGIVTHQVSDATWHSLGISQGFLRTMGMVNYHGSFGAAHGDGDFGGDVVNLFELDMDHIPAIGTWYVPLQDLVAIYTDYYGDGRMTAEVIEDCSNWLFLGRLGEMIGVIELLYPDHAERSPFLIDQLNTYYLGGIDDMALWSSNVWRRAITMLDRGTDVCTLPNNPIYIRCDNETLPGDVETNTGPESNPGISASYLKRSIGDLSKEDIEIERTDRGVYFKMGQHIRDSFENKIQEMKERYQQQQTGMKATVVEPEFFYDTALHYSRLGEHLVLGDINNDRQDDLIIGAPGYGTLGNQQMGRVYIVYGTNQGLPNRNLTLETDADVIIDGTQLNGRFGTSFAIVDINADGNNDLAVSAPSVGSPHLTYTGEVYVYFGQNNGDISPTPSMVITCPDTYCNLGWSLAGGDMNGDDVTDLVIGSPFAPVGGEQRGFVGVLYSKDTYTEVPIHLTTSDLDWSYEGEQNYDWLGYKVSVHSMQGGALLAASAHVHRVCARSDCTFDQADTQSAGQVYLYNTPLSAQPLHVLVGEQEFGQFGYEVAVGRPYGNEEVIAISSVSQSVAGRIDDVDENFIQAGQVALYDLATLGQGAPPMVTFFGDRLVSRLGFRTMFADVTGNSHDDLIMTSPLWTENVDLETGAQEGRVYIFEGGNNFPTGNITQDCTGSSTNPCIGDKADIVVQYREVKSRFGYAIVKTEVHDKPALAVSAPHSNHGGRLAGRVALVTTPQ